MSLQCNLKLFESYAVVRKGLSKITPRKNRSSHRRCSIKKIAACSFIKKESLAQVFPCEFCEIFKNTFLTEHLRTTTSENITDQSTCSVAVVEILVKRLQYMYNYQYLSTYVQNQQKKYLSSETATGGILYKRVFLIYRTPLDDCFYIFICLCIYRME